MSYPPPQLSLLSHHTHKKPHHHSPHCYTYCPLTAASFLLIDPLLWQPYAAPALYPFLISLRHQLVMLTCQSCILDRIFIDLSLDQSEGKIKRRFIEGEKHDEKKGKPQNKMQMTEYRNTNMLKCECKLSAEEVRIG